MEKETVSSQKVFIKLSGFVALAAELSRVDKEIEIGRARLADVSALNVRKQALDFVFTILELPRG